MANLVNLERATIGFGTRTLLDAVSLGVEEGDAIGVVGRNGDGKTTLLRILTGAEQPDSGRVTHTSGLSVGYLRQADDFARGTTVRGVITGGRPDHIWAAEPATRAMSAPGDSSVPSESKASVSRLGSTRWKTAKATSVPANIPSALARIMPTPMISGGTPTTW